MAESTEGDSERVRDVRDPRRLSRSPPAPNRARPNRRPPGSKAPSLLKGEGLEAGEQQSCGLCEMRCAGIGGDPGGAEEEQDDLLNTDQDRLNLKTTTTVRKKGLCPGIEPREYKDNTADLPLGHAHTFLTVSFKTN